MASKELRVNINKTKVLHSGRNCGTVVKTGAYQCAVCGKGVGSNSIQYSVGMLCYWSRVQSRAGSFSKNVYYTYTQISQCQQSSLAEGL